MISRLITKRILKTTTPTPYFGYEVDKNRRTLIRKLRSFHLVDENHLDLSSSTITSEWPSIDNKEEQKYFLKPEYEENDHVAALRDARDDETQFDKITLKEPISAQ